MVVVRHHSFDDFRYFVYSRGRIESKEEHPKSGGVT